VTGSDQPRPVSEGATLRDEFAMSALTGMALSNHHFVPDAWGPRNAAEAAYQYADAMMEARKK